MPLIAPWSKSTCLYCFHEFHLSDAPHRVVNGKLEPDAKVKDFLSLDVETKMGEVHEPPTGFWRKLGRRFALRSDTPERKKICPRCHMYLPTMIANGELAGEGIAIIGARNAGKSNFFGVLLRQLEQRLSDDLSFGIFAQDTFSPSELKPIGSRQLVRNRYWNQLYDMDHPRAVEQTKSFEQKPELRVPLIYRLKFRKRPLHYLTRPLQRATALDLAIFDAAGEDMDRKEVMERYCPFITKARGIIFLIDPFDYPGVRNQLPQEVRARLPKIDTEPTDIVTQVRNLFEQQGLVGASGKINVPVAFALSKSDLLKDLIYPGSPILKDSNHRGGFDVADCAEVSRQVMEHIKQWDSVELVNKAENLFGTFSFFALSALGSLPDEKMRIQPPTPLRIADPLLWLLHLRGYIPAK